jgi:GTP-binding protein
MELGQRIPVVAIVGRPNVGKSALFNRIVGARIALVEDLPGTTRDRVHGKVEWGNRWLEVVDTGGLEAPGESLYSSYVREQIAYAIETADVLLFVVDARDGLTAADEEIAEQLRRSGKPVLVVANKADNEERAEAAVQFYELGLGPPLPVSAYHGTGIADLLDAVTALLPETRAEPEALVRPALALVGRPNVGKSALLNAILGERRVIVSERPGTTRDAIDTEFRFGDQPLLLIDTAGIRRQGRIEPGVERHSVMRAERAIERCDVALVVMDATEPLTAQDLHVVGYAVEAAKGIVIVLNKMDLLRELGPPEDELRRVVRSRLRFAPWAPIAFVSAKERTGIEAMLQTAIRVWHERQRRVATAELNTVVQRAMAAHAPPAVHGKKLHVLYVTQPQTSPPTFVFFVNDPALVHFSYKRYLENAIRRAFGFEGTAIRLVFRGREAR